MTAAENFSPELVIATINYKTAELAIDCIDSVIAGKANMPTFKMYIVDNCSDDGSVEKISAHIREHDLGQWIELIAAEKNGGYAYGNNLVLRKIISNELQPKYVWLLNPDTEIDQKAAAPLIEFLSNNEKVAAVGSRLHDKDGTAQGSAFRFPSPINEFCGYLSLGLLDRLFKNHLVRMEVRDEPHAADWLAGASLLMRASVVREIGLMDEAYFLYFEEVDYCNSIIDAGHEIWYVPESRVYHAVGAATGISDGRKKAPRRPQYWFDSRHRYFIKNYGKAAAVINDTLALSGYGLWNIRKKLQRKPDIDPPFFFRDLLNNSVFRRGFSIS